MVMCTMRGILSQCDGENVHLLDISTSFNLAPTSRPLRNVRATTRISLVVETLLKILRLRALPSLCHR